MKPKDNESFLNQSETELSTDPILAALWWDGKGNWNKAHDQVDHLPGKDAARVHAYLHRKEGDLWNADYWYRQAGIARPNQSLEQEWESLVRYFLK